jgi:LysR family glycine cleavage system transcriptional activator
MDRRSLPLNALRTFDAAARHLNFTRAAEELGVTHGAVSRQITALEAALGTNLFVRDNPMRLAADGIALHDGIAPAFDMISETMDEVSRSTPRSAIAVNAPPTFTMKWLIPRLSGFQRRYRDAEVRLSTGTGPLNQVKLGDSDVIIRRMSGAARETLAEPFLSGALVCVCAPEVVEGARFETLADVLGHRLIEAATNRTNWTDWFASAGLARPPEQQFVRFEEMFFAVQAALDGLGLALVPLTLVADDLAAGRLTMPIDAGSSQERDYCFNVVPPHRQSPLVKVFCEWLANEGAASNRLASDVAAELRASKREAFAVTAQAVSGSTSGSRSRS